MASQTYKGWSVVTASTLAFTVCFMVWMMFAVIGVLAFLPQDGQGGNFYGFLAMFMLLFTTAGIGNGSTFRMIPAMFLEERQREVAGGRGRGQPRDRRCAMPTRSPPCSASLRPSAQKE